MRKQLALLIVTMIAAVGANCSPGKANEGSSTDTSESGSRSPGTATPGSAAADPGSGEAAGSKPVATTSDEAFRLSEVRRLIAADPPGPWSEPTPSETPSIPLCAGLTVVTAISRQGDYESIKTIESVDEKGLRLKYSAEKSIPWWSVPPQFRNCEPGSPGCAITRHVTHRTVLASDSDSARRYNQIFVTDKPSLETNPGTTALGTSAAILRELKTHGVSEFSICADPDNTATVPAGCRAFTTVPLRRIGNAPVPVRVLVNGAPVDLPAVQAKQPPGAYMPLRDEGVSFYESNEFFFLNDERNPLTLKFRLGIGAMAPLDADTAKQCDTEGKEGRLALSGDISCDLPKGGDRDVLTVTKIDTRCAAPLSSGNAQPAAASAAGASAAAGVLEKALSETGKVDIYSVYFSFNSATLRDESTPTLKEIADVLRRHPEWRLQVNGHTDGIGDDQFNLDLSKRRAAAVTDALVEQYKIGPKRLTTGGYGKSQPKDTNDTLEGRARNRRVELVRL